MEWALLALFILGLIDVIIQILQYQLYCYAQSIIDEDVVNKTNEQIKKIEEAQRVRDAHTI